MSYRTKEFDRLNSEFQDTAQTLLDDDTSTDSLENVLDKYNALITYAEIDYDRKKQKTREYIESTISVNRITLQRCFEALNLPVILPGKLLSTIHFVIQKQIRVKKADHSIQTDFQGVDKNFQTDILKQGVDTDIQTDFQGVDNSSQTDSREISISEYSQTDFQGVDRYSQTIISSISTKNSETQIFIETDNKLTQTIEKFANMAQKPSQFLGLASSLINYKFEGDPLKLASFLADVDLVEQSAEEENKPLCVTFIKRCISGRALEFIPEVADSVQAI